MTAFHMKYCQDFVKHTVISLVLIINALSESCPQKQTDERSAWICPPLGTHGLKSGYSVEPFNLLYDLF